MLFGKNESSTEAHTNLPVELGPEADALLEKKMAWAKERQAEAEQLALDAARLLSCTEDQLAKLSKQGFFKRCWNAFTGENASIERANTANLLQMQQMSLRYINMLQEQQIMTAHSLLALRNNLLTLSTKQEETQELIISLAEKTLARFEALENRVDQMEITQNLQGWLLTLEDRDYDEKFPTPHLRMMRVINDYFGYKKDDWNFNDVLFLKKALRTVGLNPKQKLSMEEFIDEIVDEIDKEGFEVYSKLLFAHAPAELENPCQFVLDNISSQVMTTLNGIYTQYNEKQEAVEVLSEDLNCSIEEAFKKLLKVSIKKLNVDMSQNVALSDIAAELLMGLSLEYRLSHVHFVNGSQNENDILVYDDKIVITNNSDIKLHEEYSESRLENKIYSLAESCFGNLYHDGHVCLYIKNHSYSNTVQKKINAGIKSFGGYIKMDDILAYYDSTLFGGGDEGVILTKDRIYYKTCVEGPDYEDYSNITKVVTNWASYDVYFRNRKINFTCGEDRIKHAFVQFFNGIITIYNISI